MTRSLVLSTTGVSLASLDRLQADVLVLSLFEDDRPLRGTAGYCDWRLCGRVSGLIQENAFGCRRGEVLLTNTGSRIGAERILLFGLGARNQFDRNSFFQTVDLMFKVLTRACLTRLRSNYRLWKPVRSRLPRHSDSFLSEPWSPFLAPRLFCWGRNLFSPSLRPSWLLAKKALCFQNLRRNQGRRFSRRRR